MILHVDMDAFYASVEQRDRPELRNRPVIVGGSAEGRGVVCAASYEARQFGVHSAMPAITARRLCPSGIFLPPRMNHYAAISKQIREIFQRYTPLVEPLSLDEAFLDVTGSRQLFGTASQIGESIKHDIRSELGLIASVGVAPNKFLAKIASDLEKPDALVVVDEDHVHEFLDPLPIGRLWGVGKVTGGTFDRLGIRTIGQLRRLPQSSLDDLLGEPGHQLWRLAQGWDDRNVVPDRQAKSISHESTFAADIDNREVIRAWLLELADQLGRRLRRNGLQGRTLHLKVRYADFRTLVRSHTMPRPSDVTEELAAAALRMYAETIPADHPPIRLLGLGISRFADSTDQQPTLFPMADQPGMAEQYRQLDEATDAIRDRFGHDALSRGSRLLHGTRHRAPPKPD